MASSEAIEGYEQIWKAANLENRAYLPFNAYDDEGRPLPKPERQAPAVMPAAQVQLLQLSTEQMRAASGQQNANFGIKSEAQSGVGIQRLKEAGTLLRAEAPVSSRFHAELPEVARDLPPRQGLADIVLVPDGAAGRHRPRPCLQAAGGQRDIGGDADIAGADMFRDPVIGGIRAGLHDHAADVRRFRQPHPARAVGDHMRHQPEARGGAEDLVAHRAGIAIHEDLGPGLHPQVLSVAPPSSRTMQPVR